MAALKRLIHFVQTKDYMKGGISVADTFNKVNHFIEEKHGKTDKVFTHEDGQKGTTKSPKNTSSSSLLLKWWKHFHPSSTISKLI